MPSWFTFLIRSIGLGLVVSAILLVLVPELRQPRGDLYGLFGKGNGQVARITYFDAINKAAPAVVNIYSVSLDKRPLLFRQQPIERTGLGSGVIMTQDGYILTCFHVVNGAENVYVQLQDGQAMDASIVGVDPYTDLAVLKINGDNLPVIPQFDDPATRVGDVVMAIGNPYNLGQTITQGIVSATGRNGMSNYLSNSFYADFIQMDAALNEGNSGGALVDSNGVLVGINNANFRTVDSRRRVKDVEGIYFAVPYLLARKVMDNIISHGRVVRGFLGISATEYVNRPGVEVTGTVPGGPADKAGILPGDILLSIDGKAINGAQRYFRILDYIAETSPGTEVTFEVARGDKAITVTAVVADLDQSTG